MNRDRRLFFNTLTMYGRFLVTLLVAFLLTPFIIDKLGARDFGLWSLLFSLLGFFELADLGFGTAITKYVAECSGAQEHDRRNRILSSIAPIYVALALLVVGGLLLLNHWLEPLFSLHGEELSTARWLLLLLGARVFLLGIPLGLFRSALFGEQRITEINIAATLSQLGYGIGAAIVLTQGGTLIHLAIVNLLSCVLEYLAYVGLSAALIPRLRLSLHLIDLNLLKETTSYSAYQSIINVSALVLLRTDPIIIGLFLPLQAVALYAVALRVSTYAHLIIKQLVNVLTPHIAHLRGKEDWEQIRALLLQGTRLALIPAFILGNSLHLYGETFIVKWVGEPFRAAGPILTLLTASIVLGVPELMAAGVLAMTDHVRYTAKTCLLAALLNVALSLILIQFFGMMGVAAATLIAKGLVDWILVVRKACHVTDLSFFQLFRQALLPPFLVALPHWTLLWMLFHSIPPTGLLAIFVHCLAGAFAYLAFFWFFCAEREEKGWIRKALI